MTILHLLPDFEYSSAARQVAVLASVLRNRGASPESAEITVHAAAPGPLGAAADWLKEAGVTVHALGRRRRFAFAAGWQLRRLVAELGVDLVHAWRRPAWRAAATLPRRSTGPALIVSQPLRGGRPLPLDRWLLRRADRLVVENAAEADALRATGVSFDRVATIPLAVSGSPKPHTSVTSDVELPGDARLVLCVGPINPGHGFRDAVWAFDVLRYVYPDSRLVIVGDGPALVGVQRFVRAVGRAEGRIHFLPARPDVAGLIGRATVVWVPSRTDCGHQVALEALVSGRPVVATRQPGLAALIDNGRTGLHVPSGQPLAFVAATRRLLDDPRFADELGASGRQAALTHHAQADIAVKWSDVYGLVRRHS
jgi:glycosyltransferase involved in cell wall biosynthesis